MPQPELLINIPAPAPMTPAPWPCSLYYPMAETSGNTVHDVRLVIFCSDLWAIFCAILRVPEPALCAQPPRIPVLDSLHF